MMRTFSRAVTTAAALATAATLAVAGPASAQETGGVEVDAPITMMTPDGEHYPAPGVVVTRDDGASEGPAVRSWTNCRTYESLTFQNRNACFTIDGSGTYANYQQVGFTASRFGSQPYTYVNARYNVDRPNGQYYWGTNGGSVNILAGHSARVPINTFIEAGNWCLRFQLQRTNGVWENWQEVCGPVFP